MSQFIDLLRAHATGTRVSLIQSFISQVSQTDEVNGPELKEYMIETCYRQKVVCDPMKLHDALKNARRQLQEAIYGNIKDDLLQLELDLYAGEYRAVMARIKKIINYVYE